MKKFLKRLHQNRIKIHVLLAFRQFLGVFSASNSATLVEYICVFYNETSYHTISERSIN